MMHRRTIWFFSRSRPSFDSRCELCIVPKKIVNVFCLQQKFSEKHNFFFDRLKRLLVVQILEVTVYQENAEHIRLITFHWQSEKVEMGGLVWESKNRYSKKLYSTLAKCATIQRTPLQGIVSRDFTIFEGMKKFYYRHSAKKCIKYTFDSRAHLKTERHLCFPTSDRLETWLLPSDLV